MDDQVQAAIVDPAEAVLRLMNSLGPAEQDRLLCAAYLDSGSPLNAALHRFVSGALANWQRSEGLAQALCQQLEKFHRRPTRDALCREVQRLIDVEGLPHRRLLDWERLRERCRQADWRLVVKGKLPDDWTDWSAPATEVFVNHHQLPAASLRRLYARWLAQPTATLS